MPGLVEDDLNLYAYVGNDPLNRTDLRGLYTCGAGAEKQCDVIDSALKTAQSPAGDDDLLRIFAETTEQRGFPSVYERFAQMHTDRVRLGNIRKAMAQSMLDRLAGLKQRFKTEPEFAKATLREIRASTQPRATLTLMRALRNDHKLVLALNDALDIQHSIVPMVYGDILLAGSR